MKRLSLTSFFAPIAPMLGLLFVCLNPAFAQEEADTTDIAPRAVSASRLQAPPRAEAVSQANTPKANIASPAETATSARLRPLDVLELRLGGVPSEFVQEVSSVYQVDDSGNLNLPFINNVHVGGLTVSQAQAAIENKYKEAEIYSMPTVTITQQNTARFVIVGGAVRAPGRVPYTPDLTLSATISAAGGVNDFGKEKGVSIIRGGKAQYYDLKKIRKDPSSDPQILPGDQINVPQSTGLF